MDASTGRVFARWPAWRGAPAPSPAFPVPDQSPPTSTSAGGCGLSVVLPTFDRNPGGARRPPSKPEDPTRAPPAPPAESAPSPLAGALPVPQASAPPSAGRKKRKGSGKAPPRYLFWLGSGRWTKPPPASGRKSRIPIAEPARDPRPAWSSSRQARPAPGKAGCPRPAATPSIPPPAARPQTRPQNRAGFESPGEKLFSPFPSTPRGPHDPKAETPRHNPNGSLRPEPTPTPSLRPPDDGQSHAAGRNGRPAGEKSPRPSPAFAPPFSKSASRETSPPTPGKSPSFGARRDATGSVGRPSPARPAALGFCRASSPAEPAPPRLPPRPGKTPKCPASPAQLAETDNAAAHRSSPSPARPPAKGGTPRKIRLPAI